MLCQYDRPLNRLRMILSLALVRLMLVIAAQNTSK